MNAKTKGVNSRRWWVSTAQTVVVVAVGAQDHMAGTAFTAVLDLLPMCGFGAEEWTGQVIAGKQGVYVCQ